MNGFLQTLRNFGAVRLGAIAMAVIGTIKTVGTKVLARWTSLNASL